VIDCEPGADGRAADGHHQEMITPMSDESQERQFMRRAIALSAKTSLVDNAGGVFGTVIVRDGEIIAEGANRVVAENDPTWHGEMEAIRRACHKLGSFKLPGCTMYTSAEPCPMCAAASYWAGIERIVYGATVDDALEYGGFDDTMIFAQLRNPTQSRTIPAQQMLRAEAVEVWRKYKDKADKIPY
jgi:guanine deaminase